MERNNNYKQFCIIPRGGKICLMNKRSNVSIFYLRIYLYCFCAYFPYFYTFFANSILFLRYNSVIDVCKIQQNAVFYCIVLFIFNELKKKKRVMVQVSK